jgi:hypothetical protein
MKPAGKDREQAFPALNYLTWFFFVCGDTLPDAETVNFRVLAVEHIAIKGHVCSD